MCVERGDWWEGQSEEKRQKLVEEAREKRERARRPQGLTGFPAVPLPPSEPLMAEMPSYFPPRYARDWGLARNFWDQVEVYRRYIVENMTFFLEPPRSLQSAEKVRQWIEGTPEQQATWHDSLQREAALFAAPATPAAAPATREPSQASRPRPGQSAGDRTRGWSHHDSRPRGPPKPTREEEERKKEEEEEEKREVKEEEEEKAETEPTKLSKNQRRRANQKRRRQAREDPPIKSEETPDFGQLNPVPGTRSQDQAVETQPQNSQASEQPQRQHDSHAAALDRTIMIKREDS